MEGVLRLSVFQTMMFYLWNLNSVVAHLGSRVVVHLRGLVVDGVIVVVLLIVLLASRNVTLDIPENVWKVILVLIIKVIFTVFFHILLLSFVPELSFNPVVSLLKFSIVLHSHSSGYLGWVDRWQFTKCIFVNHLEFIFFRFVAYLRRSFVAY